MNFSKDFLFKERVNTFGYTTATQDREAYTDVSINGRRYTKYGTLQAVTFVGNLYKTNVRGEGYWPKEQGPIQTSKNEKYLLVIGMSKQHPYDTKVNKETGYEVAAENAINNPIIMIEVQGKFNYYRFKDIVEMYLSTMNLEYIKTKQEILAEGKNPKDYNR